MTLTEQWKKGELEKGKKYWCKLQDGTSEICYLWLQTNHFTYLTGYQSKCLPDEYILEVLAPVPSYEEWQSLNQILDSMQDTNKVLAHRLNLCKDLLLECKYKIIADLDNARLCESSVDIEDFEYLLNRINNAIGEKK